MRTVTPSHLGSLREGLALLRKHPALALGLAALAMLLGQLGPALELAAKTGRNPALQVLFGVVGLLPMMLYFLPRFQAQMDAERVGSPKNPEAAWRQTFDARWIKASGTYLLLMLFVAIGSFLFVLPGLIFLTLFGWAPLRTLLRGDSLVDSFRWSQAAMARHWPRVVMTALAMALVWLAYLAASSYLLGFLFPQVNPDSPLDAWIRLRHPAFWVLGFTGSLFNLWFTAALLALYHRLEVAVQASPESSSR